MFKEDETQYCKNCYELQEQLDQLKAEKSEIKKYLGISSKTILERLEELQEFRDKDRFELFELKQTLAEIKEICKNVMPTGIDEETDKFGDILEIINEVDNEG